MIASMITFGDRLRRNLRRIWRWARRHPIATVVILVSSWLLISILGGHVLIAVADDGTNSETTPFLSPLALTDSNGVSIYRYLSLAFNRGHPVTAPDKWFIAQIVDPIWMLHVSVITWSMWLIHFVLTFEWIDWLITPLEPLFTMLTDTIGTLGWVPLAFAALGVFATAYLMFGRTATGTTEIAISVTASAIAISLLTNPIGFLIGPDGAFTKIKQYGGAVALSIASGNADYLNAPPPDGSRVLSDTLVALVVDVWVRMPYQEISFGHTLSGDCNTLFTEQMTVRNPLTREGGSWDPLRACDPTAMATADAPNWGTVMSTGITMTGSGILQLFSWAVTIAVLLCVLYVIWNTLKTYVSTYIAILPAVGRRSLFRSALAVAAGLLVIVVLCAVIAASLVLLLGLIQNVQGAGMTIVAQMGIVDFVVISLVIALFVVMHQVKKSGRSLADRLSQLGANRPRPERVPISARAGQFAQRYVSTSMARYGAGQNLGTSGGVSTALSAALAAGTGGSSAVIMSAGTALLSRYGRPKNADRSPTPQREKHPPRPQRETPRPPQPGPNPTVDHSPSPGLNAPQHIAPASTTPAVSPPTGSSPTQLNPTDLVPPVTPHPRTITKDPTGRPVIARPGAGARPRKWTRPLQKTPPTRRDVYVDDAEKQRLAQTQRNLTRIRNGQAPENWARWNELSVTERRRHVREMESQLRRAQQLADHRRQISTSPSTPTWGGTGDDTTQLAPTPTWGGTGDDTTQLAPTPTWGGRERENRTRERLQRLLDRSS